MSFLGNFSLEKIRSWWIKHWVSVVELLVIVMWAFFVGRNLLEFGELKHIDGREFSMSVSTHHFWNDLKACGTCAFWNGAQLGGYPALTNTYAGVFHPLTAITTWIWGVVDGAKIIVLVSLAVAGIAQWWISKELEFGFVARMWSSLLVVTAGHLFGRLAIGLVSMVLSTAFCSLILAGFVHLYHRRTWKASVLLAMLILSGILSGQAYIQVGLLMTSPALLILLLNKNGQLDKIWKKYAVSAVTAILLSGPFALSLIFNRIHKDSFTDFEWLQPLKYALLNFVIDDIGFFDLELLERWPSPNLYIQFIGWVPLILAFIGMSRIFKNKKHSRVLLYFMLSVLCVMLATNAEILMKIAEFFPFVGAVRHIPLAIGISVPAILVLSAFAVDDLLKSAEWPELSLKSNGGPRIMIPIKWIILLPLIFNIKTAYTFAQTQLTIRTITFEDNMFLDYFETDSLQWVLPIYGEQYWTEMAISRGMKVTGPSVPWWPTENRQLPVPRYRALRTNEATEPEEGWEFEIGFEEKFIYVLPDSEYAYIKTDGGGIIPCKAQGRGAYLSVSCTSAQSGYLIVHENALHGWRAEMDGQKISLIDDEHWLVVESAAGEHEYTFAYFPLEAYAGIIFTLAGLYLSARLLFQDKKEEEVDLESEGKP